MKIKLLFLTVFCVATMNAQKENENERELRIKNKVSEMLIYEVSLKTGDSILTTQNYYDKSGNLLKSNFFKQGKVRFRYLFEYNKQQHMTKMTGYNDKDSITTMLAKDYDAAGNEIEYKQFNGVGKLLIFQKRTYNEKNQNTELHNKRPDSDEFFLSMKYFYYPDGLYSKNEIYNGTGKLMLVKEYEYDEKRLLTAVYDVTAEKKMFVQNTYDAKDQLIEKKIFPDKVAQYKYDSKGNKTEELGIEKGTAFKKLIYIYK